MAKTITQLPDATSVADADELIVQQSGITKRATKLEVIAGIKNASIASDAAIAFSKLAALDSANILVGNGSNVATKVAVTGDVTISNAGVTAIGSAKVTPTMLAQPLTLGTAPSTTGTSLDFTGIPSWAKRITVMLNQLSTNGTAHLLLQLGDSGGIENSGYVGNSVTTDSAGNTAGTTSTSGFVLYRDTEAQAELGIWTVVNVAGNTWIASHTARKGDTNVTSGSGVKELSATLDRVRVTTTNGTDAFDSGLVNIMYEG
jgi:hypothetical protein